MSKRNRKNKKRNKKLNDLQNYVGEDRCVGYWHGHPFNSIGELANLTNVPLGTMRSRWYRGIRDVNELASKPRKKVACDFTYEGTHYTSLARFARDYDLIHTSVVYRYNKGVHDPAELIKLCQEVKPKPTITITYAGKTYSSLRQLATAYNVNYYAFASRYRDLQRRNLETKHTLADLIHEYSDPAK